MLPKIASQKKLVILFLLSIFLRESEIIFLKQQLSELLQENHKLRINAEKEDSSGILKQQLSEVLKENQELRATKSVQKDDTNGKTFFSLT